MTWEHWYIDFLTNRIYLFSVCHFEMGYVHDITGGTVDITVHEVTSTGKLREMHKATGGSWGGTSIDKAYFGFMESIFGSESMTIFQKDHLEEYLDMEREFDVKKRSIGPTMDSNVTFRIPSNLFAVFREVSGNDPKTAIQQNTTLNGKITLTGEKMRVEAETVKCLFTETNNHIVQHVKDICIVYVTFEQVYTLFKLNPRAIGRQMLSCRPIKQA